jgi:hypothetical protein
MKRNQLRAPTARRALVIFGAIAIVIPVTRLLAGTGIGALLATPVFGRDEPPPRAELVNLPVVSSHSHSKVIELHDSLFGRSGQVRVRLLDPREAREATELRSLFGNAALDHPNVLAVATNDDPEAYAFITLRPWRDKRGNFIGAYKVGTWPAERSFMPANYDNPTGFIEVTPSNQTTRLSEHFRLRDFITHDKQSVWPKYVVLREALLDKLELVLATLKAQGVPTAHVEVLSGFRSPQYNAAGYDEGMARASRHQYGDAADIIIDDDHDGRMDDLNHDGRVDYSDTDVIQRAVERVERMNPDLVGGLGLYRAIGPSGPFAHIDVRGTRARWTNTTPRAKSSARLAWSADGSESAAQRVGGCAATGASAALCVK